MILGSFNVDGCPSLKLPVAGQTWAAVIDTGFNGDLELPDAMRSLLPAVYLGRMVSVLAAGQHVVEDYYEVEFPFDGRILVVEATFHPGTELLMGTNILRDYRLEVYFPHRSVEVERVV